MYLDNGSPLLHTDKSPHDSLAGETILYHFGIRNDIGALVGNHHEKGVDYLIDVRLQDLMNSD